MAPQLKISFFKVVVLICALIPQFEITAAAIGICYGEDADNLPAPSTVVQKFKSLGIKRVRLYHTYKATLQAFANSGIDLTVGITNDDFPSSLADVRAAKKWIDGNILLYLSSNIKAITVGNEVLTGTSQAQKDALLPCMKNLYSALQQDQRTGGIKVNHAHAFHITKNTYPPSAGEFIDPATIRALTAFLSSTKSPFLINVYPYFTYQPANGAVTLQQAVLNRFSPGNVDKGRTYDNLLFQQVDAVYAALGKIGQGGMHITIGEIGWPSAGGNGATVDNARTHNQNVVDLVKQGTPLHPTRKIDAYLFAMFNENNKSDPAFEKNFGLYRPNLTPVYKIVY